MRKLFCLLICLGMLTIGSTAIAKDFRDTSWGMSKEQVKEIEPTSLFRDDTSGGRMNIYWHMVQLKFLEPNML